MIFKIQYLKSLKQFFETKKWVSKNSNNVCSNAIYLLMEKNIKSSDTVGLFEITLNRNINFKRHIQDICHKTNNKTKALFLIRKFVNIETAQVLTEAYIS